ncbi:hypothetical protein CRYUN_Cryun26dG0000900 [Craigia yunnanensis]
MVQALGYWDEKLHKNIQIDVVAYNVLIHGLCLSQNRNVAYGYFAEMLQRGLLPDVFTYNTLISALCKEEKFNEACHIHGVISTMGIVPDQISYKVIIQGLCACGDIVKANEFRLSMLKKSIVPSPIIWNLIIDCYGRCGDFINAFSIRDQMLSFGVAPNLLTGAASNLGHFNFALQLHDEMLRRGDEPDIITYTELIRGHCKRVNMEAEKLFAKLQRSGVQIDQITDVELPRLVPPSVADNVTQNRMTSTAGTFCYIDPEYQQTGMLGIKSDIYSLGIMLLQLITAKPPMGLTHHVERAVEKRTFAQMLDPAIPDWPVQEAMSFANIALNCAELRRKDRSDLGKVVLPELNRLTVLLYNIL